MTESIVLLLPFSLLTLPIATVLLTRRDTEPRELIADEAEQVLT